MKPQPHSPQIALIYDKVNTFGGAERVLLALHQLFPQAPLFTSVYHSVSASWAKVFPQVIPSFLQKFPFARSHSHWYSLLMPLAFESFNFDQFDLVISVTSGGAKGIITRPQTLHLCYCLTPTRFLWVNPGYQDYRHFGFFNPLVHSFKSPLLSCLRSWDQTAAFRPDVYATTSRTVAQRIQKYYRRKAAVIPAPVDTRFFKPETKPQAKEPRRLDAPKFIKASSSSSLSHHPKPSIRVTPRTVERQNTKFPPGQPFFLLVSRLIPYKKIDIAIKAFQQLKLPLKIAGTGPELDRLKSVVSQDSAVELLGHVDDQQLRRLYQRCQALILPQEEDFGLVALEAQSCGKPVIAYRQGGATETIVEGKTGLFFDHQTPLSLVQAIKKFALKKFTPAACRRQALNFSLDNFKTQMKQWVTSSLKKHHYPTIQTKH